MKKVIAIDGPSGAGKSTIARMLAKELGFDYLDTGAMYRAIALRLTRNNLDEDATDDAIAGAVADARIVFENGRIFLDEEDVSDAIRSPEAGHYASVFSARRPVREYLLFLQRDVALSADLVAEGRDMTTVVFPDAYKKFYLDASVEERARRRTLELASRGFSSDAERVRLDILERDARDAGRSLAPLRRADDAFLIDSTGLDIEEVFRKIMDCIEDHE